MQASWIRGAVVSILLGPEVEHAGAATLAPPDPPAVPLATFVSRLEDSRAQSPDQLQAWRAGESVALPTLGSLGEAVADSRRLGDALNIFARGFPVLQSNSRVAVDVEDDEVHISYQVLDPRIWPRRADAELTLGLMRMICGRFDVPRNAIRGLSFEYEPDRDMRPLFQHVGCTARFAQDTNRISLPARVLTHVQRDHAGDVPARSLDNLKTALREQRRCTPVSHRVQELIFARIGRQPVNQLAVAAELGMSERSLRRALAQEGSAFHDILEECRRIQGFALLVRSERQFSEIALLLGYSDQTAFSRAFSRWYGAPPRELRRIGAVEESVIR